MLETIAGAVAGPLVSGLFGLFGKKKKKAPGMDFARLVRDSSRAGFNPLTALGATGGAGYVPETVPRLSPLEVIGDVAGAGISAALNYDPTQEERDKVELDLLKQELDAARARAAGGLPGGSLGELYSPGKLGANVVIRGMPDYPTFLGVPVRRSAARSPEEAGGEGQPFKRMPGTVTNPFRHTEVDSDYGDAEAYEARYGELGELGAGVRNVLVDTWQNVKKLSREKPRNWKPRKVEDPRENWLQGP